MSGGAIELHGVEVAVRVAGSGSRATRAALLTDVTLAVRENSCTVVMGASGAGKSTLAHVIAGLRAPTGGVVVRHGLAATGVVGPVSLVLQRPEDALSRETVFDEIASSLRLTGMVQHEVSARVLEALSWVGLDGSMSRRDPLALSGGEQRRVAIAAVLALRPRVLILDEPSAGLDAESRDILRASLLRLRSGGVGLVVITHDATEAGVLADELVVLAHGRVAFRGDPVTVLSDPHVAAALGVGVATEVRVAYELATMLGQQPPRVLALDALAAAIVEMVATAHASGPGQGTADEVNPPPGPGVDTQNGCEPARPLALPHAAPSGQGASIDVRARTVAWVALIVAAFAAGALSGVAVAFVAAVAGARVGGAAWRAIATAMRPLMVIAIGLGLIQWATGAHPHVALWHGHEVASGAAFAVRRIAQVAVMLVGSLALGAQASALELAGGLRFLLRPLRPVIRPGNFEDLTMALGIGVGATTAIEHDLEMLELAQRARGIDLKAVPLWSRLRFRALLAVPLFVLALRRSRQLAESLYMRGYRRGMTRTYAPRPALGGRDLAYIACALALLVVVRLV